MIEKIDAVISKLPPNLSKTTQVHFSEMILKIFTEKTLNI
jgi:hypothetical protein